MADKIPLKLSAGEEQQFQAGDTVPVLNGGTGTTTVAGILSALGLTGITSAWTDFSSTINPQGFSSVTVTRAVYFQVGKTTFVEIIITGTSNATTFTFTLPSTPTQRVSYFGDSQNAGVLGNAAVKTRSASATTDVYTNNAEAAYTNSGTKTLRIAFFYENT